MTSPKLEIDHKAENHRITLEIRESNGNFQAFIKETVSGSVLPVRMGFLEFVGSGEKQFMVLRAPIRQKDSEGQYLTRARQKDGKYLDEKGREVESEEKASREFVYLTQKNDDSKLVYAQVGSLNVQNKKADHTPTAVTLINAKLYSDEEALNAERLSYKLNVVGKELGKEHADYAKIDEELKDLRRKTGSWHRFFINAGADILRTKGFEVRVREHKTEASPAV